MRTKGKKVRFGRVAGAAGAALAMLLLSSCSGPAARPGALHSAFPGTPLGKDAQAAMEDAKSGDPAKVRALLPYFATEDNERLVRFVVGLKGKAVPPLVAAIDDPDPFVAEVAAGLVGNLRAREGIPKLVAYLQGRRPRRYVAAWALGEIKDPGTVPVLIAALADENPGVQKAATRALINIGKKASPALIEALPVSSGRARKAMLRVLEDIEDVRAEDAIIGVLDADGDAEIKAAAARALSKCGTAKSFVPLERWLGEGTTGIKVECAWSLGILQAKPAEDGLRRTLEDPDVNVREWSARALENITGDRVLYRDASGKMVLPYNLYR